MTAPEGLELFEAPIVDEVVVVSPDVGVVMCGAEIWHVKGQAQVAVAGLGEARFFVDAGAGLVFTGIKAGHGDPLFGLPVVRKDQQFAEELDGAGVGDAGDADEQVAGVLELLVGGDEVAGPLTQGFDLGIELGDALLQISDQEVECCGGQLGGMELVFGLGTELVQSGDAAGQAWMAKARSSGRCQGSKGMRRANWPGPRHRRHRSWCGSGWLQQSVWRPWDGRP